ncbi:magnesium chelatase subunit D [Tropicimonas sp. IMCC34043]|uniref:magnesium chelatase subunit D n=1 Tax=Tropicimonas sp. IMCC34043 TaxID=2248760 RepID=UPI000E22ACA0|nr:magnesium chelatase subunit D [Tropicimonas sp. IMCC34043]
MTKTGVDPFDLANPWHRAVAARDILAVDSLALGGLLLRARHGPVRTRWLDGLGDALLPLPLRRLHPQTPDEALYGAIDVAATLQAGQTVRCSGVLTGPPTAVVVPMADTAEHGFAARLSQWLDARGGVAIALDEGNDPDERAPASLMERLAFHISLDNIALRDIGFTGATPDQIAAARAALAKVQDLDRVCEQFVNIAAALGINSLRPPAMAGRAAVAAAALAGLPAPEEPEIALATALVLAPRLQRLPEAPPDADSEAPDEPPAPKEDSGTSDPGAFDPKDAPDEVSVEAAMAQLPPGLLEEIARALSSGKKGGRSRVVATKAAARGRFAPSRPGQITAGARIDLLATMRRAAPWQPIRRRTSPDSTAPILIRPEDIAISRRRGRAERVAIFAVDASGSTAMGRLAECKGAIELLLAEAYQRRDHVAMIIFRGLKAEVLLPPTRSLVQTKRRLASVPGGGPTPLASGLEQALLLAEASRHRGMDPSIVLMTDGRGNIALDGSADREAALADLQDIADAVRRRGVPAMLIDIARLPRPAASALAERLAASYLPLPVVNARSLSEAVQSQWDTTH